ncbi:MAG: YbaK/EbsC family protein [Alphaproteobacteria bacterium]
MKDIHGLMEELARLGLACTVYTHEPLHTVADGAGITDQWPMGAHIKNLFVKDKAGKLALITCLQERRVDLVKLGKHMGIKDRWSFANEEVLWATLGVRPGAVTPLGLINAVPKALTVIWDEGMFGFERMYPHPLINTQTLAMAPEDVLGAVRVWGHEPVRIDLGQFVKPV